VLVLATAASAGSTASPAELAAWLSAQREASGIPGALAVNADWSQRCSRHIDYMRKNDYLGHDEDPAKPGYSEAGAWAGGHAVLAYGRTWSDRENPFESAPIHLVQLLAPQLAEVGAWDESGYQCMTTWPGYARTVPKANSLLAYPGEGATVAPAQTAAEVPFVPGDFVGLPLGTVTGPHIYVYAWGPWTFVWTGIRVEQAELQGPEGAVELRHITRDTAAIGNYLPPGSAILIPVRPLRPGSRYEAAVTLRYGAQLLSRSWSFRTAGPAADVGAAGGTGPKANPLRIRVLPLAHGRVKAVVLSPAEPRLTLRRGRTLSRIALRRHGGSAWLSSPLKPPASTGRLCARSGGGQTGYRPAGTCLALNG
jgi:hypothetical protein